MLPWWISYVLTLCGAVTEQWTPPCDPCVCTEIDGRIAADCSDKNLTVVPNFLPHQMTVLNMSLNNLESVVGLNKYNRLTDLNLSFNIIFSVQCHDFSNLQILERLDLLSNRLSLCDDTFPRGLFRSQRKLKQFFLQNNSHTEGKEIKYPDSTFKELISLEELYIDGLKELDFGIGFTEMKNLKYLVLGQEYGGKCATRKLTNKTFTNLSYLQHLDLSGCQIIDIEADSFADLSHLHTLILSNNVDLGIPAAGRAFYGLQNKSLQILNINGIYRRHGMGVLVRKEDIQYLNKLNLEELHCENNRIELLELSAVALLPTSLKRVSFHRNRFVFGPYILALSGLVNLIWADVSELGYSHISVFDLNAKHMINAPTAISVPTSGPLREKRSEALKDWPGNVTIYIPPNVTFLNFSYGKMDLNIRKMKSGPNKLKHLDLSHNYFSKWYGPVLGLDSLEVVDLSNNFCTYIAKNFTTHFPAMRIINISSNYLGDNLDNDIFNALTQLEHLEISDNKLHYFPETIFKNTNQLRHLNLSYNYLSSWQTTISHLRLEWIDISHNAFKDIPSQLRIELKQSISMKSFVLYLQNNPLVCDCTTLQSVKWMMEHKNLIYNLKDLVCKTKDAKERQLSDLQNILLELNKACASYVNVMIGILSIAILLLSLMISGVLYRYRWKLRYLYHLARFRHKGNHTVEEENQFEFDAFISYADEDRRLVVEDMRHKLEGGLGLKLCIHHRDFLPGEAIADNILKAIKTSRRTVVILSKKFLESYWCRYEVEMAKMEHIYTARVLLLIVVLEDIPVKELPSDIIDVMRQESYVEYTQNKDDQGVFWQSLGRAIKN